jgi:uncharacterized membrane protein YidH (DUF202 family)
MTDQQLIDVGAQAERTALAWQRTGIGLMAVAALLLRWEVTEYLPVWPGVVIAAVAGVAVLFVVPDRYRRVLRAVRAGHTPRSRRMLPAATVFMILVILCLSAELAVSLMA